MRILRFRSLATLAVAGIIVTGTFAFTATNNVDASKAGEGSGVVSGYHVGAIHYWISETDPSKVDAIQFTLDAPAVTVYAFLENDHSKWYDCDPHTGMNIPANTWKCFPKGHWPLLDKMNVEALTELEVMAAQ